MLSRSSFPYLANNLAVVGQSDGSSVLVAASNVSLFFRMPDPPTIRAAPRIQKKDIPNNVLQCSAVMNHDSFRRVASEFKRLSGVLFIIWTFLLFGLFLFKGRLLGGGR